MCGFFLPFLRLRSRNGEGFCLDFTFAPVLIYMQNQLLHLSFRSTGCGQNLIKSRVLFGLVGLLWPRSIGCSKMGGSPESKIGWLERREGNRKETGWESLLSGSLDLI